MQRKSEQRRSRLDNHKKSFLPRPSHKGGSLDRMSGVQPLDSLPPSRRTSGHQSSFLSRQSHSHSQGQGHRTAESASGRSGFSFRPNVHNNHAQRPSSQQTKYRPTMGNTKSTPSVQNTPLCGPNYYTPTSAMSGGRRTPSGDRKHGGRLALLRNALLASPSPDPRPLSDQRWQRETSERVVSLLRSDDRLSQMLPTGVAPLKPITIKLFLNLINSFVGPRCQVNSINYIDKLPVIGKKFLYPGVMTKSWLKSVNAMHTYPQMLGFLSYMLDLHNFQEMIANTFDLELLYGVSDDFPDRRIHIIRHNYYIKCWDLFQEDPGFEPNTAELDRELREFRGVNEDNMESLLFEIRELEEKLNDPEILERQKKEMELLDELNAREDSVKHIRKKISLAKRENDQIKSDDSVLQKKLEQSKNQTNEFKRKLKELHEKMGKQKMTTKQHKELLEESKRIRAAADSKHRLLEEIQNCIFEKDVELTKAQKVALESSIQFNKSLVTVGLAAGINLSSHSLEERELLAGNTIKNIKETESSLKQLELKAEREILMLKQQKCEKQSKKQNVQIEINSLQHDITTLKNELDKLERNREQKKMTAITNLNARREILKQNKQKVEEKMDKTKKDLETAQKENAHCKDLENKWRCKVEKLRSEEPRVHEMCKQEVNKIIEAYTNTARQALPDLPAILAEMNLLDLMNDLSIQK